MSAAPVPVVLLHGLGRTSFSMRRLERALDAHGHPTLNLDYPSRRRDLRACARHVLPAIVAWQATTGHAVAFVGHSMGGLVARVVAAEPVVAARAIVMLGPPNRGSEVADYVHGFALGRRVFGPALGDLRTTAATAMPRPSCPIGVIAGRRSYLPFTSRLIPDRHDGLVSLERSRLDGADWISLDAGHTFLMNHHEVVGATTAFLERGSFPDRLRG